MLETGEYYIGDLCYVIEDWDMFCAEALDDEGEFLLSNGVKGCYFLTRFGDGTYSDQNGGIYPVDAGLIGCIRTDIIEVSKESVGFGVVVTFESDFLCFKQDGVLNFGHIRIRT